MISFDDVYWDNTLREWLLGIGAAVATYVVLWIIRTVVAYRLKARAEETSTIADDLFVGVILRTKSIFMILFGLYVGSLMLNVPLSLERIREIVGPLVLILQGAFWGRHAIQFLVRHYRKRYSEADKAQTTSFGVVSFFAQVGLWSIVLLLILDNFGVDINTLIAGLGVGGIAVALAAQRILSDVFQSVAILLDKPFEVGDFIIVGDKLGNVERIGIKTTRIRSLQGEEIVFSNDDLVSSRIQNYKRMAKRRIVFTFGVIYQTSVEKLESIPGMVREICSEIQGITLDRVHFKAFGDFALIFEVVYFVKTGDYATYMDVQQKINLALCRRFQSADIGFAYPTQTIFLERSDNEEARLPVTSS